MALFRMAAAALFVLGCTRAVRPVPAVVGLLAPVERVRARQVPYVLQAKLSLSVRSEARDFQGTTGAALILDRPRGHFAVLGPLGGPLATLQSDGVGVAIAVARDKRHYVAASAESVLRETTGGTIGVEDLFGILVGDVPLDAAPVKSERPLPDGTYEIVLEGPRETTCTAVVDPKTGVPVHLRMVDADGVLMLDAHYAAFEPYKEGEGLLPTEVSLRLPGLDVEAQLRFKSWSVPSPVPEVFGMRPPDGFSTGPLESMGPAMFSDLAPAVSEPGRMAPDREGG